MAGTRPIAVRGAPVQCRRNVASRAQTHGARGISGWMVGTRIHCKRTLQGTCAQGAEPGKGGKNRDFGRENRYYPVQGFCFASIGPRFSPFVVVLLPRIISTLFDSA